LQTTFFGKGGYQCCRVS